MATNVFICCRYKIIAYVSVSNFNFPNTRKTQTNGFRGGLPGSPVAGPCAVCGEAEGAQLSKSGGNVVFRGPKSCLSPVCREGVAMLHNDASWGNKREQV